MSSAVGDERLARANAINRVIQLSRDGDTTEYTAHIRANPSLLDARWDDCSKRNPFDGRTALHFAAERGDVAMVALLIGLGAEVSLHENNHRSTPLHLAKDPRIIDALIKAGADVHAKDFSQSTPLSHVSSLESAKILLAAGADVNEGNPLSDAIRNNRQDVAYLLLERGAKVNSSSGGSFPLYTAACYGRTEMVTTLLDAGAKVHSTDARWDPVQAAIQNSHADALRLLLAAGGKVPPPDAHNWNALHKAAFNDADSATIDILIRAGVDPQAKTKVVWEQRTIAFNGGPPIERKVPKSGGSTPLHLAVERGNFNAATALIAYGVDLTAVDAKGNTPLDLTYLVSRSGSEVIQGTNEDVALYRAIERHRAATENANRRKIAEMIQARLNVAPKSMAKGG